MVSITHRMGWHARGTVLAALGCALLFGVLAGLTLSREGPGTQVAMLAVPGLLFLLFAWWYGRLAFATWKLRIEDSGVTVTRVVAVPRTWEIAPGQLWQYVIEGSPEGEGWLTLALRTGKRLRVPVAMSTAEALSEALDTCTRP